MIERCVMLWNRNTKTSHRVRLAAEIHDGGSLYRQQEQLRKKAVKEITFDDISKGDFPKSKLKQVVKHQMQRADWWEQQAKQNEAKAGTTAPTKQDDDMDKDKIIEDLRKEIKGLKNMVKVTICSL